MRCCNSTKAHPIHMHFENVDAFVRRRFRFRYFFAVVFFAVVLLAVAFFAVAFFAVVFFAVVFFATDFFSVDFFAVVVFAFELVAAVARTRIVCPAMMRSPFMRLIDLRRATLTP